VCGHKTSEILDNRWRVAAVYLAPTLAISRPEKFKVIQPQLDGSTNYKEVKMFEKKKKKGNINWQREILAYLK